jgi:NTE family protein
MDTPMKVGLVLSGGGAKGAYQVGVLKALRELGTRIDAVSGASIGALNGGVLASSPSLDVAIERLEAVWERLANDSPLSMKAPGYLALLAAAGLRIQGAGAVLGLVHAVKKIAGAFEFELPSWLDGLDEGLLDDQPLKQLMDEFLDSKQLATGLPLYVSLYRSNGGLQDLASAFMAELGLINTPDSEFVHIQSLQEDERKQALLASAAIPLLFASRKQGAKRFSDGGQGGWQTMQGNTPITPLLEAGCNLVIVTHLSDGSPWSRQRFPEATILEIRPQQSLNRATGLMSGAQDLLGFDVDKIPTWIEQGYQDTLHCVGRVMKAQQSRDQLRGAQAALASIASESAGADDTLADAMARLSRQP